LAISPCPNDTFLFEGFHGSLDGFCPEEGNAVRFLDIAELNTLASEPDGPDLIKVSCASVPRFLEHYRLLPCGGAMGEGCGPLLLKRPGTTALAKVALPGRMTTAHVLFRHWLEGRIAPAPAEDFLRFDEIPRSLLSGGHDHGVVIHETRFTFRQMGLEQAVDLGEHWERTTGSPIPLGALLAKRSRGHDFALRATRAVQASLDLAWSRTEPITPWIAAHAQEIEPQVQRDHIRTYVTAYSRDIGERGLQALRTLWTCAGRISPDGWPHPEALETALEEAASLR
jgi:1,4-dihydroxy-6-naphthoate synthase